MILTELWGRLDCITIQTDKDTQIFKIQNSQSSVCFRDITLEWQAGKIFLSAFESAVRKIEFHFMQTFPKEAEVLGDAWERSYGDLRFVKICECQGKVLPWYCIVNTGAERIGYGVKVRPNAFCGWKFDKEGISLIVNVCCGKDGVRLNGRKLKVAETVYSRREQETFSFGQDFCRRMTDSALIPTQKIYGMNNWLYAYGNISEESVLQDAEYASELTSSIQERPYMVIDDGWQVNQTAGPWHILKNTFQDMGRLATDMKEKGVKPGLWIRPLYYDKYPVPEEWILWKGAGQDFAIDITVPEAEQFVLENFARIRNWGYQLIKYDFSFVDLLGYWGHQFDIEKDGGIYSFSDKSRTSAEIIVKFYQDIKSTVGKDVMLIGCNTASHLSVGSIEISRTGDDTHGEVWERTKTMGVNTIAYRLMQHNVFYLIDGDCVGLTDQSLWDKQIEWMRFLSVSGTPLFVSSKKGFADKAQQAIISKAFETNQMNNHMQPIYDGTITPNEYIVNGDKVKFKW